MSKIRGEYWIQDGRVDFADGDVGDQNHEMVALNHIASEFLDGLLEYAEELGIETDEFDRYDERPFSTASELMSTVNQHLRSQGLAGAALAAKVTGHLGMKMEVYKMLGGGGDLQHDGSAMDARIYMMIHEGWIAVRSNNIELFGYDANKKRQLANGIEEILDQEGVEEPDDQVEFNLYDHKTGRSSDMTLSDIKNTNSFARPQQLPNTTYNKPMIVPADRTGPMGSQAPKAMSIQQKQAMQTSEGRMGFKKWLEKEPSGFLIRRKWPV